MANPESLILTDPTFTKKQQFNIIDKVALKFIRDERDLPFVYLCLKILVFIIPVAVYLFTPGNFNWYIAFAYLAFNSLVLSGPFTLMLHNTSHRKLFKKDYEFLNNFIPWVLGPFYGQSPETYFAHHIGMHHLEDNLPPDLSSTMHYQRDSIGGFLHYFGTFFFFGIVQLSYYFKKKSAWWFLKRLLLGEFSFFMLCIGLSFISWQATLMVFVLPFLIIRFAMMAGNWGQHAFIDADDAANNYKNSITCINSRYNRICFNDGYHIGHHIRPNRHWTDMPDDFLNTRDKYAANKAIVFDELDFFVIWFHLMTKNYKKLAKHFVDVGNRFNGDQEAIIAFLKTRTARISKEKAMEYVES